MKIYLFILKEGRSFTLRFYYIFIRLLCIFLSTVLNCNLNDLIDYDVDRLAYRTYCSLTNGSKAIFWCKQLMPSSNANFYFYDFRKISYCLNVVLCNV